MKRFHSIPVLALLCVFSLMQFLSAGTLPKPEEFRLKNGVKVFFLHDPGLPLVSFRLLIPGAGSLNEPQEGLSDLTADLILKGNKEMNAEQIAAEIDFLGASLGLNGGAEFVQMSGKALADQFPKLITLAASCLTGPAFPEKELEQERTLRLNRLKQVKDNPHYSVRYYFQKAYFGTHPLGALSLGNETALKQTTRKEIEDFYRSHFRPEGSLLAVCGDIAPADLKSLLNKTLTGWKSPVASIPPAPVPPIPVPTGRQCLLVDKPDATQAYFILGVPGLKMGAPETPESQVFNTLFGGRFTSWLNEELRIKRGLTYGATSYFQQWKDGGVFTIFSFTKNDKIGEMLGIVFDLIEKARNQGFSNEEITSARNYILGQFPPTLEDLQSKAEAYTTLPFYGMGFDYYDLLLKKVSMMDGPRTQEFAGKILSPSKYVLVVVGKADEIQKQLEPFGTFTIKKISDPGF